MVYPTRLTVGALVLAPPLAHGQPVDGSGSGSGSESEDNTRQLFSEPTEDARRHLFGRTKRAMGYGETGVWTGTVFVPPSDHSSDPLDVFASRRVERGGIGGRFVIRRRRASPSGTGTCGRS